MVMNFPFDFGAVVVADGGDVHMRVQRYQFSTSGLLVECGWFHNGDYREHWFYDWQLKQSA